MPWKTSVNAGLGQPAISLAGVDTERRTAIGTIMRGFDDLLGEGEFIYLPGIAGTIGGDAVVYDLPPNGQNTTRALAGTHANTGFPVAVAIAAVPVGSFGWYQISGCAVVNTNGGSGVGRPFLSANAGALTSGAGNGAQVIGARLSSTNGVPAPGQSYATLNRPAVQTQTA